MKKLFILSCIAIGLQAAPALADCAEKLQWAKLVMSANKTNADDESENKKLLDEADAAANNNDKQACDAALLKLTQKLVHN